VKKSRILHIVAFTSPSGEYGGPTRVADNLTLGLSALGQDVTLISTSNSTKNIQGGTFSPIKLFKSFSLTQKNRFGTLISPSLFLWLLRNSRHYDLIHVHIARDFVTLPAALFFRFTRRNYVVQPHGMILPQQSKLLKLFDLMFTKPALKGSQAVYYLSAPEKKALLELGVSKEVLYELKNGISPTKTDETSSRLIDSDVLFLARLAPRKRPQLLLSAALDVLKEYPTCSFSFVGPDEGELEGLVRYTKDNELDQHVTFEGSLSPNKVAERMKRSRIYVLPALNEPFGMTIIEALSIGIPVIITESAALAPYVLSNNAGLVVPDNNPEALSRAIVQLLRDEQTLVSQGQNGKKAVSRDFSIQKVSQRLLASYNRILKQSP
jgi:glycosyltransferase involved in cell wall biosynthesis